MKKFTVEEKLIAVKKYLDSTMSYQEVANILCIDKKTIRTWVRYYQHHGIKGLRPQSNWTNYPKEFKLDVIEYINVTKVSYLEAAARFNIASPYTISRWMKAFETGGEDAFQSKQTECSRVRKRKKSKNSSEIKDLKKEINYLRAENAYLKKLRALVLKKQETITVQMKTQMVNELRPQYPLCLLLGIAKLPRSTYYYNIEILKRPDQDAKWKKLIQSIFDKHEGRYGYRRICDTLKNLGYTINHKKVQRIMNELGLKCKVRIKKYRSYKGPVGKKANNILNRDFSANRPNEKWVTDITEFKLFGEKFYLSPVLDLFNGEIISYTIRNRPTYSLVGDMLDQALNRLSNKDQLLMHSDQGWHYRMERFRQTLKKQGITQSMSRKGNCFDNAVIENFFGILKTEFIHYKTFRSEQHFLNELNKYINYYNHERIKSRLNRMSPVQYRTHYEQQIV